MIGRWGRFLWSAASVGLLAAITAPPVAGQDGGSLAVTVTAQESGNRMPGVQVNLENTTRGGVTGSNGRMVLENVRPGTYNVEIRMIGYAFKRIDDVTIVSGQTTEIEAELRIAAVSLDGIVTTGVVDPTEGIRLPFTVGRVTAENLQVPTTASALGAIQGKVAGVNITRASGQPGSGVYINLRTPTSIQGSNSPLFVVDGTVLGNTFGGTTMDIESLDIESVEVIKGAAAAALYGSQAAAGVISITTSRGRDLEAGTTRFTVRSEIGNTSVNTGGVRFARHHQFRVNEQGEYINSEGDVVPRAQREPDGSRMMRNPYAQTFDNVGTFFQPADTRSFSGTMAYNSAESNLRLSFNRFGESGTIITNDGFTRTSGRLNFDHRPTQNVQVSGTVFHSRSDRDELSGSPFWDLLFYPVDINLDVRDENGNFLQVPDTTFVSESPIWRQTSRDNQTWRTRTLASGNIVLTPIHWLTFRAEASYDRADLESQVYVPRGTPNAAGTATADGQFDRSHTGASSLAGNVQASLRYRFGDLRTRMTMRATSERQENQAISAGGRSAWVVDVPRLNVFEDQVVSSSFVEDRANAFFVQTALDYRDRYIFEGLVRRDGSSRFGPDARWATYYRASASYRMAQEYWFPFQSITEFKPRVSVGTAGGRPGISWQFETWSVGSSGGVSKGVLGNRFLKPEHTTEIDMGLDIIFQNRHQLELTYARQTTVDQLISVPVPAVTGYVNQYQNSGEISGHSYELTFSSQLMSSPRFSWNTTFIADHSSSEITEWNRACFNTTVGRRCQGVNLSEMWGQKLVRNPNQLRQEHIESGSTNQFQVNNDGFLVPVGDADFRDGLWGTRVEIDGRMYDWGIPIVELDENGNSLVQYIGDGQPTANLGWMNQFRIGNINLHMHLHSELGGNIYNATKQRLYQHERHADLDQAGRPEQYQKPTDYFQAIYNFNNVTDFFAESGNYLKLRELSASYRLPQSWLSAVGLGRAMDSLSFGVVGRNLLTFTNYDGFDPEQAQGAFLRRDNFGWPIGRTLTLTVDATF